MSVKTTLHQLCCDSIEQRLTAIRQSIEDAHQAGLEETKSSSGDKYETGRAMMHLEMEKLATQLTEAEKLKSALSKINPNIAFDKVQTGSLVYTSMGNFYVSVSAGVFTVDGAKFVTLSSSSPLGSKLLGLGAKETMSWNNQTLTINALG